MTTLHLPRLDGFAGSRCLVTGGAGFIGSSLVRILLNSGATVTAYDNLATGHLDNLAGCRTETDREPEWQHGDVRDGERLSRVLPGHDVVFNLACLGVRHSIHSPFENQDVNGRGTLTVLQAARQADVRRVVHVSTSEVYGTARTVPMSEDHPTDPHTVYGGSKLAGECYARAFHRCYGSDVVVVRPFNAYGPRSHHEGDSGEVIPRFLVRALAGLPPIIFGDGSQTRDLTHVYDTATVIARAALVPGIAGETFNAGSTCELTIKDLAAIILQATDRPDLAIEHIESRPGDVLRLFADSTKAKQVLGHEPQIRLADGIRDLADRLRRLGQDRLSAMAAGIAVRNWI